MKDRTAWPLLATALLLLLLQLGAIDAATVSPHLSSATAFGILSKTYVNAYNGTVITGNLGYTGTAPTISPTVSGTTYISTANGTYNLAVTAAAAALASLNGQSCTYSFPAVSTVNLATDTTHGTAGVYAPGIYCVSGAASLPAASTITLTGKGSFVFRIAGAFSVGSTSTVALSSGAVDCTVWWTVAGATTLGANATFVGNLMSQSSSATVTVTGYGISLSGRIIAPLSTVTTNVTAVTAPAASCTDALATTVNAAFPAYITGAVTPYECLLAGMYVGSSSTTASNDTAAFTATWSGPSVFPVSNTYSYCQGCHAVAASNSSVIPTISLYTNNTSTGQANWTISGNSSVAAIACTAVANCSAFWTTQWPQYVGSLTGTQCVSCIAGYCRGAAQLAVNGTVITSASTCTTFDASGGALRNSTYSKTLTNQATACACQSGLNSAAPTNTWRIEAYNNVTKSCTGYPKCGSSRPTLFTVFNTTTSPPDYTIQNILVNRISNRNYLTDNFYNGSINTCSNTTQCDKNPLQQGLLTYVRANLNGIIGSTSTDPSATGVDTWLINNACIQGQCLLVRQQFGFNGPVGWNDQYCRPSLKCSYGLGTTGPLYLPPGGTTTVDLNATLFNVPYYNPCRQKDNQSIGTALEVYTNCSSANILRYNATTETYRLVSPPSNVTYGSYCGLFIACDPVNGYGCDNFLNGTATSANMRGSFGGTIIFATGAGLSAGAIVAIVLGAVVVLAAIGAGIVACTRGGDARGVRGVSSRKRSEYTSVATSGYGDL